MIGVTVVFGDDRRDVRGCEMRRRRAAVRENCGCDYAKMPTELSVNVDTDVLERIKQFLPV